jgi:hypothetical protein
MMYARAKATCEGDAYDIGLDEKDRDTIKQAFNAMVQAKTQLTQKPKDIDLSNIGMSWNKLKQLILDRHEPIHSQFFKGTGNELQYLDSRLAEEVLLEFTRQDIPCLPIHDSFIMHHGYADDLTAAMRNAFDSLFNVHVDIKAEKRAVRPMGDGKPLTDDIDELLKGEPGYSQYTKRLEAYYTWREHGYTPIPT